MNGRMNPRDKYYAELQAAEVRRAAEARRAEEEVRRRALAEKRRRHRTVVERRRRREQIRKRQKRRAYAGRFLLFIICFALIFTVVALCVFVSFQMRSIKLSDNTTYTYVYGDGKEKVEKKVSSGKMTRDGIRYVDFSSLSDYLSLTVIGGAGSYRFVVPGGTEEVLFADGSDEAVVNGEIYRMKGNAEVEQGGGVWVPLSFVKDCMTGVIVTENEQELEILFTLIGKLGFTIKKSEPLDRIPNDSETDAPGDGTNEIPEPEFTTDLSAYEQYMDPEDRDAYLVLVNAWNNLPSGYVPDDLCDIVNTRKDGRNTQKMRECAEKALEALFLELYACGYDKNGPSGYPVSVMSAYRSYSYQEKLFNSYVEREMRDNPSLSRDQAEAITETYSARPGTSEHQTGLCIDMHNLSSAQRAFADQDAYLWLRDNAWKFGFVLRFPEDKQEKTGITFEPWHYRFVGRYHAYRMWKMEMCLEEYVEYLENE